MPIDPLLESTRVRVEKSVLIALAMIGSAIAAFISAVHLFEVLDGSVPVANLFLSISLCTVGFVLSGMALHGRGSWREVVSLALPVFAAALAAFRFGPTGVVLVFAVGVFVYYVLRWRREKRQPKPDET